MFSSLWQAESEKRRSTRTVLRVEHLETRYCPAAPVLSAFSATVLAGASVQLTGTVQCDAPANVSVDFSGVADGSTGVNADGSFSFVTDASSLGNITAVATDFEGFSDPRTAAITSTVPSLTTAVAQSAMGTVTVSGQVSDDSLIGMTVVLSGIVDAVVSVNADGTYQYTGAASGLGEVHASAQDVWGQESALASATLTNAAPVIRDFAAINRGNGIWELRGQVEDEFAPGLVVRISGLPAGGGGGLSSITPGGELYVTVGADGWFSTFYTGNLSGLTLCADVNDWWLAAAESAYYLA